MVLHIQYGKSNLSVVFSLKSVQSFALVIFSEGSLYVSAEALLTLIIIIYKLNKSMQFNFNYKMQTQHFVIEKKSKSFFRYNYL